VQFLVASKELPEAIEELSEILELEPDNREATLQLFHIYQQIGDLEMAVQTLENGRRAISDDITILEQLASTYLQKECLSEAVTLYEELLRNTPESVKVIKILAELYRKSAMPDQAAELYLSIAKYDSGCYEESNQFVMELLAKYPDRKKLYEVQSAIYLRWYKPEQAVETYRRMLALFPDQLEKVIADYRKVLEIYPDFPEANFALAEANIQRSSLTEAVLLYSRIITLNPAFIDMVIKGLQKVIELCPEQMLAHQVIADCYFKIKEYALAIQELRALLKYSPGDADTVINKARAILAEKQEVEAAHLLIAEGLFSKGEGQKARVELEKISAQSKEYARSLMLLSRIEFKQKEYQQALAHQQKALALPGKGSDDCQVYSEMYRTVLGEEIKDLEVKLKGQQRTEWVMDLARKHYLLDHLDLAMGYFQQAVGSGELSTEIYFYLGKCFKEQGNFEAALRQFQKGLQQPGEWKEKLLLEAAFCAEALGELNRAAEIYQAILEDNVEHFQARMHLQQLNSSSWVDLRGKTLLGLWNNDLVLIWYKNPEAKITRNRDLFETSFAQGHNNQGVEYAQKHRFQAAGESFQVALSLDENYTTAHNNLGVIELKLGKIQEAKEHFLKVISINPEFSVAYVHLALAMFLEGDLVEAGRYFKQALDLDKELGLYAINYGDVLFKEGRLEEAVAIWQAISKRSVLYESAVKRLTLIGLSE
ncbi:MAG: tetratricopeptide repeat protein, partial [Candidatus Margulisiibacteriota bacterium]